jgi:hypothetical protein
VKQKRLLLVLVVLVVTAGLVWLRYFKSDSLNSTADASSNQDYLPLPLENPQLHKDRIDAARKTEYQSGGRNIFTAMALAPQVSRASSVDAPRIVPKTPCGVPVGPCQDPPPPPPVLPYKFYGYGTVPNGTGRRAFLTDNEGDVYVVPEGGVLLNRYRILKVGNASLEFEEVSTGRRGTAPLEEQAAPPGAAQ